jgi:hypothetical protein
MGKSEEGVSNSYMVWYFSSYCFATTKSHPKLVFVGPEGLSSLDRRNRRTSLLMCCIYDGEFG